MNVQGSHNELGLPVVSLGKMEAILWVTIFHGRRGRLSFRCSMKKSAVVWENEERLPVK